MVFSILVRIKIRVMYYVIMVMWMIWNTHSVYLNLKYKIIFITYCFIEEVICNLSVTLLPLPLLVFHCEVLSPYVVHT